MIILGIIAYYVLAIALIATVVFFAVWQNKRSADAAYAQLEQDIQRWRESTPPLSPPLPPFEIDDEIDTADDDEDVPDLSSPALQPIAPLLFRAAKEYLDKPDTRERLLRSLSEALGEPIPGT